MDRNVSTAVKNNLFGTTWKSDIAELKILKEKLLLVKDIELYLPYAAYKQNENSQLEFMHIDKRQHNKFRKNKPYYISYMVLFLRDEFNKQTLGLELKSKAEVIPQLYTRKHWYYYEWNKHELTIRRILGTFDGNKIEKMVNELMNEYKRFYLMYCNTTT